MSGIAIRQTESSWGPLLRALGPTLLAGIAAILLGYGTVKFTEGATQRQLQSLEEAKEQQLKTNEKFLTRDEMKIFMETTSRELTEIHNDVRSIRTELRKQ